MTIECEKLDTMLAICVRLVREGLTFTTKITNGVWVITLTGGY